MATEQEFTDAIARRLFGLRNGQLGLGVPTAEGFASLPAQVQAPYREKAQVLIEKIREHDREQRQAQDLSDIQAWLSVLMQGIVLADRYKIGAHASDRIAEEIGGAIAVQISMAAIDERHRIVNSLYRYADNLPGVAGSIVREAAAAIEREERW